MNRLTLALALSAMLAVVGCGRDDDRPTVDVPQVDDDVRASLFDRIDADSIYLMANLAPLPESLSVLMWESVGSAAEFNQATYGPMLEDLDHPLARALMQEFLAIDGRESLEARGLHGNGLWAIHGLSLYPVMHWQLIDPDAFAATLDRIAVEAGMELPWRRVDDQEVLWIEQGEFGLALHYDDEFLTAALVPDNLALLRRIAGLDRPARAYRARDLRSFGAERGFTEQGSGFFDFGRLLDRLLDEDDELAATGRRAAALGELAEDPACAEELRALTHRFPRMSLGMTHVSGNEMAASWILETDPELGSRLARIADSPVELKADRSALFSAGIAFNLVAARDFGRATVAGWVDNPPRCGLFAGIRDNAAEWQVALNRPIPPIVTNLQGLRVNLQSVDLADMGNPKDASGTLAVFMRNPQMMIGMAQMFSPELAALDLRPGGEPQPLPRGLVPDMPDAPAWIAMGQNSIGLAVGEDQKDKLGAALEAGESDSAILHYGMDFGAYAGMVEGMMGRVRRDLEEAQTDLDLPADEGMFAAMGEIYDFSEVSVHLKPHGIVINSWMRLKD